MSALKEYSKSTSTKIKYLFLPSLNIRTPNMNPGCFSKHDLVFKIVNWILDPF